MVIRLPWWFSEGFAACRRVIIVKRGAEPWLEETNIEHERVHTDDQMTAMPLPRAPHFHLFWLTDGRFRMEVELQAFAVDVIRFRQHFGYGEIGEWVESFAKSYVSSKAYNRWRGPDPTLDECKERLAQYVEDRLKGETHMAKFRLTTALAGMAGTVGIIVGLISLRLWVEIAFYVMLIAATLLAIGYWRLWIDRPKA